MAIDQHFQRVHEPVGLVIADGFPWPRLVTGMVAVAISMALGWRAEEPAEPPHAPAPRSAPAPQPAMVVAAAAEAVEQPAPAVAATVPAPDTSPPPVAQASDPAPAASPQRHQVQRRTGRAKDASHATADRKAVRIHSRSAASAQGARATSARSRAEVRNEYIAGRAQVAALTGEDSGSDYLARMAARRHHGRTVLAGHAHHQGPAGRRAPSPS